VWPEFADGGKAGATVAHAHSHRAGVPAIRKVLTDEDLFDWARMTAALAATEAWWVPGERLAHASAPRAVGHCPILGEEVVYGLGFQPTTSPRPLGPNGRSFGHFGTGGALGFADPDAHVAFGYAMNHVIPRWQSARNRALVDAVFASLAPT